MNLRLHSVGQKFVLILPWLLVATLPTLPAANQSSGDVLVQGPAVRPQLFFACCDGEMTASQSLFADGSVITNLENLNAGVAIATDDLSPARAQIIERLNRAGIPVVAWFVVPSAQGYYLNAGNAKEAAAHFDAFEQWTAQYRLRWSAVGLDIEPDIRLFDDLAHHRTHLASEFLLRYFEFSKMHRARLAYGDLIRRIQSRGYSVQTYQLPLIVADRNAHVTLLERLLGIVDVRAGEEVVMIYPSFNKALGPAMIWTLGSDSQAISIGTTNGGNYALNWDEFSSDLVVAAHFSKTIGVFNLEGSVERNYLVHLGSLDWNQPVTISAATLAKARRMHLVAVAVLWLGELAPFLFLALVIAFAWALFRIGRWLKAHRAAIESGQRLPT